MSFINNFLNNKKYVYIVTSQQNNFYKKKERNGICIVCEKILRDI